MAMSPSHCLCWAGKWYPQAWSRLLDWKVATKNVELWDRFNAPSLEQISGSRKNSPSKRTLGFNEVIHQGKCRIQKWQNTNCLTYSPAQSPPEWFTWAVNLEVTILAQLPFPARFFCESSIPPRRPPPPPQQSRTQICRSRNPRSLTASKRSLAAKSFS